MSQNKHVLLVCTVGGRPEPIVAALKHWSPVRVWFVHTPETRKNISEEIVPKAQAQGIALDPGRYELLELIDGQDLAGCLLGLRDITPEITKWTTRGEGYHVVVDFTGGTKCMSAALAIQASRWTCEFSYIGGTERNRGGLGDVVSGTEQIFPQVNPWDAMGYQAVEEFEVLFNQHAFANARELARRIRRRVSDARRNEFYALEKLADGFDAWDRFDHKYACDTLKDAQARGNDLRAALGDREGGELLKGLKQVIAHLEAISQAQPPSPHHVRDLLANAKRRRGEERMDDGVARLYRAIEATAQLALKNHGFLSTDSILLEQLPEALRTQWASRAVNGTVKIGLQEDYELLESLGDPLGGTFRASGLIGPRSPLIARNNSILAHGFKCVSAKDFEQLWMAALKLAQTTDGDLPPCPQIADRSAREPRSAL